MTFSRTETANPARPDGVARFADEHGLTEAVGSPAQPPWVALLNPANPAGDEAVGQSPAFFAGAKDPRNSGRNGAPSPLQSPASARRVAGVPAASSVTRGPAGTSSSMARPSGTLGTGDPSGTGATGQARAQAGAAAAARALSTLASEPAVKAANGRPIGHEAKKGDQRPPRHLVGQQAGAEESQPVGAQAPDPHDDDILPARRKGFLGLRWR